jgi:hypothetical protein
MEYHETPFVEYPEASKDEEKRVLDTGSFILLYSFYSKLSRSD